MSRAAIRYAKALLSLAQDQKTADVVNKDMELVSKTISENQQLSELLKNAVVKSEVKKAILTEIFSGLNALSTNLFNVLIENKRIDILENVAAQYTSLYDDSIGKEIATVTTAVPMTNDLEIKVLAKVKELTPKSVELHNVIDESILGGFILRIGDKQYNASIANKLNKLRREFSLN
ncbi:MAG: ATP synthase F1 subunit delta [Flavobacteriaceae bacterium]|nr:ATP synthase F1 subunit delta [Mangrovimonas sp.]MCB0431576.1 ATP synthase F1 subunit delta [Mangrovimonas sp.]MCB0437901.1 ATP synthase F1 subunit delta [Mangrovimonas sp.]HPF97230.1 ATP synthase F1 subunit delta [Mangrovimonas sp.]